MAAFETPFRLDTLPVELLYEIQLYALSPSFPHTSRHFHHVFKSAPTSFNVQYILSHVCTSSPRPEAFTRALRYPLCDSEIFSRLVTNVKLPDALEEAVIALPDEKSRRRPPKQERIDLPRRLFRHLIPPRRSTCPTQTDWTDSDHPLPFLRKVYLTPGISRINTNAYDGYALTKAVHAGFLPLVKFLLGHGASPKSNNGLSVNVAIRQRNLPLVRLLIERSPTQNGKRRRMEDRITVTPEMLNVAVRCNARDIVEYFTHEKGAVPDLQTLLMMS